MREWHNTVVCGAVSAAAIVMIYGMFARRMQLWGKAVLFGTLSATVIVLIYATPPYRDSHFGGANFGYNFSFFFPALLSSFLFWIVALGLYVGFLRRRVGRSPSKIILPPVLLLPFALQAAWIIRILLLLREPV
jgi:hypothetical protein